MAPRVRFNLSIQVLEAIGLPKPFVDASVQVWIDEVHYETIKLVDYQSFEWPDEAPLGTAENTAAVAGRIVARMLDEVQFEAIAGNRLHHKHDYDVSDARNGVKRAAG